MSSPIELSLQTTPEGLDWVRSLLASNGLTGEVLVSPNSTDSTHPPSAGSLTLRLRLPTVTSQTQIEKIVSLLSPLQRTGMATALQTVAQVEPAVESGWLHRVGKRFLIVPEHYPGLFAAGPDLLLRLPNHLAFGSGFHPATRLALELLECWVAPSMQTLDLGSGSGILSLAMARLGATVLALDNDSIAVTATQAAVQLNQLESQIRVRAGSLGQGNELSHWLGGDRTLGGIEDALSAEFDLIVANVLARIHIALASDYRSALRPHQGQGGLLITAGFTEADAAAVDQALVAVGFTLVETLRSQEWIAFAHRLPADAAL